MKHSYGIEHGRIMLKPMSLEESELYRKVRNDVRDCFIFTGEISYEQQQRWFMQYELEKDDYMFSVIHRDSGKWIGGIALYGFNPDISCCEYGRVVAASASVREKGLGREAVAAVCRIAFESFGVSSVAASVLSDNDRALACDYTVGFRLMGNERLEDGRTLAILRLSKGDFYNGAFGTL